jgi:hypothetical protein
LTSKSNFDIFLYLNIVKERRESLKRALLLLLLIFPFLFNVPLASPNLQNSRGLFRVLRADIHEGGKLLISLEGEVLKYPNPPSPSFPFSPIFVPGRTGRLDVSYTPLEPVEIYGTGLGIQQRMQFSGVPTRSGFGDFEIGFKLGESDSSLFNGGIMGFGILPSGKEGFSNDALEWGGRGLLSLSLGEINGTAPLGIHGNIGYRGNRKGREDELLLGLGLELPTLLFTPIVEFTSEQDLENPFFENPARFTSGIRFESPFGFVFDFGYDVNLVQDAPVDTLQQHDWSLLFGVQFSTSLGLLTPKIGKIKGKVMDHDTGEPLSATLQLLREKGNPITSDSNSGEFTFKNVTPGLKTLQIRLEGYKNRILPVFVKEGETTIRNVTLKKSVQ